MIKKTDDLSVTESLSVVIRLLDVLAIFVLKEGHEEVAIMLWEITAATEWIREEVTKWEM